MLQLGMRLSWGSEAARGHRSTLKQIHQPSQSHLNPVSVLCVLQPNPGVRALPRDRGGVWVSAGLLGNTCKRVKAVCWDSWGSPRLGEVSYGFRVLLSTVLVLQHGIIVRF